MKFRLLAVCVSFLIYGKLAYAGEPTTAITEQMQSTQTCSGISVSSFTSTIVSQNRNGQTYFGWRYVSVQDLDGNNNVDCNDAVNVATQTTTALLPYKGQVVSKGSPGATVKWDLVPGTTWYCMSENITGPSNVVACVGR